MKRGSHHSAETRAKISEACQRRWANAEYRNKIVGRRRQPEARAKSAEAARHLWANAQYRKKMIGRRHRPETIEKISVALRDPSPDTRARRRLAQGNRSPGWREKLRQANLRRPGTSVETREKLRQARLCRSPIKMTDIERALYEEFKRRGLDFIMHLPMWGRWQPDFLFESSLLIVQADGWQHRLADIRTRDAAFNAFATAQGWTVWRFSDRDIKTGTPAIGRAVAAFMRQHTP